MADKKSVNLLPEYLRSNKNDKFLSSTIDQLIQTPQLERIDGFIGSKVTPNYDPANDVYLKEDLPLRKNYQLEPALVLRDSISNITDVIGYDDIINELSIQGGRTEDLDRLFRSNFYSYDPLIDWDKLVNYSEYYWLPTGPEPILIDNTGTNLVVSMLGQPNYLMDNGYSVSNGMKLVFSTSTVGTTGTIIQGKEYIVEGVGEAIKLVDFDKLEVNESLAQGYNETFDSTVFDDFPFDGDKKLPITPEYITINKSSQDLNPWSRYNRWTHKEVIRVTAEINNQTALYPVTAKAKRPIVEFKPNLQLYKFGVTGIQNIDLIDTDTQNAFETVDGSFGYYIDGVLLEHGQRIIFNADLNENVRGKIYQVAYTNSESPVLHLTLVDTPEDLNSISVNYGIVNSGKSFYYSTSQQVWVLSQQRTVLNQAPLFDLFDADGVSYTQSANINDFAGSKLFGYAVGTGTPDSVLGFALRYQNSVGIGSYLFSNYFMTDVISSTVDNVSSFVKTGIGYIKSNNADGTTSLVNVWKNAESYQIPIIETQVVEENTNTIFITSLDRPYSTPSSIVSYINNVQTTSTVNTGSDISVTFNRTLSVNDVVQLKITTEQTPNENGYYETPLSLTNNPLNSDVSDMTLSELEDHLSTMVSSAAEFTGKFPGTSNLRDVSDYTKYGTRLVINSNPIAFAMMFLGKKEHNVVDALRFGAEQYNQFKMNLLRLSVSVDSQLTPADALDYVLKLINNHKDNKSAYYRSDMLPYGADNTVKEYTVGIIPSYVYPLGIEFDPTILSFKSILIYLNDVQLIYGKDYEIDSIDGTVTVISSLVKDDVIKIVTYLDTLGCFVPPTPSKLGLYPKYEPELYIDTSYTSGNVSMIRGHDGSVMQAYGDYRDEIILEFEKRVYNNIKVIYNTEIFDVKSTIPGAFRNSKYTLDDANRILRKDYMRWAGMYNVDVSANSTFDENNSFTWNYKGSIDSVFFNTVPGYWRGIYQYFYDTDRPHSHPWEMLGFTTKPTWWAIEYGPAPYTSSNTLMWTDLKNGYVRGTGTYKTEYARSQLLTIIPVDTSGNLKAPDQFLVSENAYSDKKFTWAFGDRNPAETAWHRSSYWPFAVNAMAALLEPCNYTSSMYDVSRTTFNQSNQLVYAGDLYLNPKKLLVEGDYQISGVGSLIIEKGKQTDLGYVAKFQQDLSYLDFNLFHKLGGFASKEKLQIIIDSIDPVSTSQGAVLPPEDCAFILNISNPVKSANISGIIVQKSNGKFVVKGYDRSNPYFEILKPIKTATSGAVTVGGVSSPFTEWTSVTNNGTTGISETDLTSVETNTSRYYKQGQIVRYNSRFYRVKIGHVATSTFDETYFQQMSSLPMTGGATAQQATKFETAVTEVPYGTEYNTIQEVYDLIVGYGAYLEKQGFLFDQYSTDLKEILDWQFTGKEFLFWTTQNWADGNLITLSPFANTLRYKFVDSIVDNIASGNYEYSLLKADGKSFPISNFNLSRQDGVCTINTLNTEEGIFFATLNSVQKEHAIVFNNTTIFNDTIYDIESGYRQRRVKITGFRTANWNGDLFSPGFIYDSVEISDWKAYGIYLPGKVVRYNGVYYESSTRINGDETFDFNKWVKLSKKPAPDLLPNFDYKINQFEDFYSLDIDNFDYGQQQLAQHLIGYTPRTYLNNIFTNATAQYKFYQGFIREKGTRNAIDKIVKAGTFARKGDVSFNEDWAFRVGHFGGFETYKEIEFKLEEGTAIENPYVVKFISEMPSNASNLINYTSSTNLLISPSGYNPAQTFKVYNSTGYEDTNIDLTTVGYVRLDDVTSTAYNKNSLLDIANNSSIQEGDTIWMGFLENGDWDVYRYSRQTAKVSGVYVSAPATAITFTTDIHHSLAVGDIVSVVKFNDQVNGVYIVTEIPELNQFTVASGLTTIVNDDLLAFGALFKFDDVRYQNFEELKNVPDLRKLKTGEKIWIDNAPDKWAVYQKIKNYDTGIGINSSASPIAQQLGFSIYASDDIPLVIVSAPTWDFPSYDSTGRVSVLEKNRLTLDKQFEYIMNSNDKIYCDVSLSTGFGYSLNYDNSKELIFTGAPEATNVRSTGTSAILFSTGSGYAKSFVSEGLVKISSKRPLVNEEITQKVLVRPNYNDTVTYSTSSYARFGHSIYLNQVVSTSSSTLLVSAPGDGVNNTGTGHVYAYYLSTTTSATNLVSITQHLSSNLEDGISLRPEGITQNSQMQWGHKIAGDYAGKFIAISAPGYTTSSTSGIVQIFDNSLNWKQTIVSPFGTTDIFGDDVYVSASGKFMFISSVNTKLIGEGFGKVAVYTATNLTSTGTYILRQVIDNPVLTNDLKFGQAISLSKNETVLTVSSLGKNRSKIYGFDEGTRFGETTFDQGTTRFISPISDAGAVYVYNNLGDYFIQAEELNDADFIEGSRYGTSVVATNDAVYVGAPWYVSASEADGSTFFQFNKIDNTKNSWSLLREQPDLVEIDTVKRIVLIDSVNEEVIEYLDVIDPLKGKIAGIAEQELKYKSASDPATYSIGTIGTINDSETNWIDEHVGELWWDLSTAKYVWYEQGDDIFRKNNWGKLFPGATIDVYEWVKSNLLPTEWASQADTSEGLTNGISGQPKYPDNSIVSVKQVWNTVTNSFENVFFFWVKNKVLIPDAKNRRISAYQVSSLIADPVSNGLKFAEILSSDSVAFANIQPMLIGNYINANISTDEIKNSIPRHTEWLLLEEGSASSMPNTMLNKKLFDSLLGRDALGNLVPDINLSYRNKYGIGIRPQQTLFKDRLQALRNIVEFANSVLIDSRITGNYSFSNLERKEEIPDALDREYDLIVEDLEELTEVDTSTFKQAYIECFTLNGKVISAVVTDPGFGYALPPKVNVNATTGIGAVIETEIDVNGRVINAVVTAPGSNYVEESPVVVVRPHTVIVQVNTEYGNRWTKHIYDYLYKTWLRIKTQTYNTPLYWKYADWVKSTYDGFKDYKYVVNDTYEVATLNDTVPGDYVKIKNAGDGNYIILEKLTDTEIGDFSTSYDIIYRQNGTVQILDTIWNYSDSNYAYDVATLEETLYDQIPDLELFYILTALKDDIFVRDLKINWNLLFFKAVKYALTEQKLLDWAFKTSFINVKNNIGSLDQRSVYQLENEQYFEDYIKEVKPYRTKIRSYTSIYNNNVDQGSVYLTDFDLPSYYNSSTGKFEVVQLGNTLLDEYPRKSWNDNYKYYVKSIEVGNKGAGYTQRPNVQITTALGDSGVGAKAEAYIRNGELYKVLVTHPGSGYVTPPLVTITGGGQYVTSTATVSVVMGNDTIRKNTVGIKFDRVGTGYELGDTTVTETFVCSGDANKFVLSWLAEPNKSNITPLVDGKLVLATDYTIEYYTETYNNYTKKYSRFVFLNYVPGEGQIFKITYNKNINLYTAVDRIHNYYEPTDSMPGLELPLLMSGAEFGETQLQGLRFDYSPPWGHGAYDNNSAWSDLTDYYASAKLVADALYNTGTLVLSTTEGISPGQKIILTNTALNYLRTDTVVVSVNTGANSIEVSNYEFQIKRVWSDSLTTRGTLVFYTVEDFGGDIRVGDYAEIWGINGGEGGTLTGFDGRYQVTGVGTDRFTAIGTGTHWSSVLSTSTVRSAPAGTTVRIPSMLRDYEVTSTYKIYSFADDIINTTTVYYDTLISIQDVSTSSVYLDYSTLPLQTSSLAEYVETTATSSGTLALTIRGLGLSGHHIDVDIYGYPKLEFWKDNFNVNGVDTELTAGSWDSAGNFVGALGVNPTDLTVNGSGFLNAQLGYAPEEHVKGQTFDSVSINVYTQENNSSPLVISGAVPVVSGRVSVTTLPHPVTESVGVQVEYKGLIFDRLDTPPNPGTIGPYFSSSLATPIGVSGAPIGASAGDDTFTGPYSLGFNWNMFGTVYTEVYVGTNGYVTFGGGDTEYTPLNIDALENPSIMVMFCDLWQAIGIFGQPLENGQLPGLWFDTGTISGTTTQFNYWRLRFQGSHYQKRDEPGVLPAYQYELGLYSDGVNQYVEMIYENTWREYDPLNASSSVPNGGFITGISNQNGANAVQVPYTSIQNNTSHVFYSTSEGGNWQYAGQGSFDPNKEPYNFTARNQFFIYDRTLYIAPQTTTGRAGYTLMTMGGDYLLDSNLVSVSDQSSVLIPSLASIDDVRSVYVTVNGTQIFETLSTSSYGYMVSPTGIENNRAAVTVYNIPAGTNVIQAWFFETNYPEFNGVWTEYFNITTTTTVLNLTKPIANIEPISAQVLVEYEALAGAGRRRLSPPDVTYYKFDGTQLTFNIDNKPRPSGTYSIETVHVYLNGFLLRSGFDYTLSVSNSTITFPTGLLVNGDAIAIESLIDYDYIVSGNTVILSTPLTSGSVKVTTFTDHDGMLIRTERFSGNSMRRFTLSLPVISAEYVWVYVDGAPLIPGYDFGLLPDQRTIQLSEWIFVNTSNDIMITSINSPLRNNVTLGYRIFKDIFDRTSYTRLSDFYSTRLTKELTLTDTEIHVEDSSRLIPPNPIRNIPGVVFVDSERIEFFEKASNTLSNLRRSTHGTAPALFSEVGTKLMDQSTQQQVPYSDVIKKQYHITTSTTNARVLSTVTNSFNTYTFVISTSSYSTDVGPYQFVCDGITLSTSTDATNQVTIKYGGRTLRKTSTLVHDSRRAYDTTSTSLVTLDSEFTVVYNSLTNNHELKLNIEGFVSGVRLEIEQRTGQFWQPIEEVSANEWVIKSSLLTAVTPQAMFIQQKTTELPDYYYYGGDPTLTDNNNFELTDDNNNPIEGY
jgi:hypothetical protein